ncbi:hypothetical protein PHJA_001623500 [Phtheirospermum japonicum]|uniref:Retrovirus-related Pol polyprotein from transposon TNT 1-94 n=1 Tax=Phtheirospermum japonicum TaxID=374723 RepID=A0A830CK76_9LAMI|nr:hypothetical protein PHJA_001623500 [Phtheirospermum japonicum]
MGFLDGSKTAPPTTVTVDTNSSPNPAFINWKRQDQLILHALLASLTEVVIPLIAYVESSSDAWSRLDRIFSKRSQSHIIHFKYKLSSRKCGTLPISNFLLQIKTISDELSTLGAPLTDVDILIYCMRGLSPAYKKVIAALRTRNNPIPFEELYDKKIDHETYLHDSDQPAAPIFPTVQYTAATSIHLNSMSTSSRSSRRNIYVASQNSQTPTSTAGLLPTPSHQS